MLALVPPSKTQDSVGRTVADAVNGARKTQWIVTLGVEVDGGLPERRRNRDSSTPAVTGPMPAVVRAIRPEY